MIKITIQDTTNLRGFLLKLENLQSLMGDWKSARETIFDYQFNFELTPENTKLRRLSTQYMIWKMSNYPGRKKRELTGKTRNSHQIRIGKNRIIEEIGGHAEELQNQLGLPLLPNSWTDPTQKELTSLADRYVMRNW